MKHFRTLFLPLLLCVLILLLGFFAPTVFDRLSPDFKNEVQTVSIAGTESPLYIADSTEIKLPPWDAQIFSDNWMPASTVYWNISSENLDFFNTFVADCFEPFLTDGDTIPADTDFFSKTRCCDSFFFLQDLEVTTSQSRTCRVDLVLCIDQAIPLYVHVRYTEDEVSPISDADSFESELMEALDYWFLSSDLYNVYDYDMAVNDSEYINLRTESASAFTRFLFLFHPTSPYIYSASSLETQTIQNLLWSLSDFSVLEYEDESLLVLADSANWLYCVLYDSVSNRVTGYGTDSEALFFLTDTETAVP